jgi:hypothetical protein
MTIYMSSFYPLCSTKKGRAAVSKGFPEYIDGSCRREPDFQNEFPAITGLCRPGFATKLKKDDIVIYTTNKKGVGSRKIVAVLEVMDDKCKNHQDASNWYKGKGHSIPNNIMVEETKPFDLNETHQKGSWNSWIKEKKGIKEWDEGYKKRAKDCAEVAICRSLYKNLIDPPELTESKMDEIFNGKPGTQNPAIVSLQEWKQLKKIIGIR